MMTPSLKFPIHGRQYVTSLDALLGRLDEAIDTCCSQREAAQSRMAFAKAMAAAVAATIDELDRRQELLRELWANGTRLRNTTELADLRELLLDIVIVSIGCERVGLFERVDEHPDAPFEVTASLGLCAERKADVHGRALLTEPSGGCSAKLPMLPGAMLDGLSAFVPLLVDGRVNALLLLWELQPPKQQLNTDDQLMLDLLRSYAGPALARAQRVAARSRLPSAPWPGIHTIASPNSEL